MDLPHWIEGCPLDPWGGRQPEGSPATFHGWLVLGKTLVASAEIRQSLLTALKEGLAASEGDYAMCFDPRHAIRATAENGEAADVVICFECDQVEVYLGPNSEPDQHLLTTASPEPEFDKVLREAGVPLARKSP